MSAQALLFTYGTLRRGAGTLMGERLASSATYVGDASVSGVLYDTGPFPACVAAEHESERVYGEVWALRAEVAEQTLAMLDQYEGFAPDARFGSLFLRVRVPVRFEDGSEQEAWMYRYNQPPASSRRVESGDWMLR